MSDIVQGISEFFDRQAWADRFARPFQKAVQQFFNGLGPAGGKLGDFLNGVWLGHPLHPVLTDIPIGAWTAAITLDAMEASSGSRGVGKAADAAVLLGVAGAVGSAVTGVADWQHSTGEMRRIGFLHATLNTLALGLFVSSLFARKGEQRGLGRLLAMTGFGIVGASAYLGGDLVFRKKMGVNHAPEDIDTTGFVPVIAFDQLEEGHLKLVMLNNIPIVVLRRGEQIYALAETCAHLGGPLADGKVVDLPNGRPAVVCPWHSSTFDMDNGEVNKGPSAYPQPCFETRIRDGQVEVMHRPPSA